MKFSMIRRSLPSVPNVILTLLSCVLLVLAFPDFEFWYFAWFGLVPFFYAIEREKSSLFGASVLGWIFGTGFFFGTCWWLSFAMFTYGGLPKPAAFFLVFVIVAIVGLYSAIFAVLAAVLLRRLGSYAVFSLPFLWTALEFARYHLTFNNWNQIAYSQAFNEAIIQPAQFGGIYLVGFLVLMTNAFLAFLILPAPRTNPFMRLIPVASAVLVLFVLIFSQQEKVESVGAEASKSATNVVAIQVNVPMSGLNHEKWLLLRQRHVELAEKGIEQLSKAKPDFRNSPLLIIFSESPMNFMYAEDAEFRQFIGNFAQKHNAYVLFNSAEPNAGRGNYFNSAVLVDPHGAKAGQYDKIFLVPFGEYAPVPESVQNVIPTLIGSFELGSEYDLFDIGGAKAAVVLCYESHFPTLSRRFVQDGADVLIEMTNDGYLGETGVLRQHLASAVFRAVETDRPLLRTTNVGITAYITPRGEIIEPSKPYTEDLRTWSMQPSSGTKTLYVRFGDWFAWVCTTFAALFLLMAAAPRKLD